MVFVVYQTKYVKKLAVAQHTNHLVFKTLKGDSTILAIDLPCGKHNHNIKIRGQLRILKCITIVKEASRKVLKHVY